MEKSKILIVEDEYITALDIKVNLLTSGFYNFDIVATGEEAVDMITNHHFDIILMDIKLKGRMDGIEAAIAIRDKTDIPVVYISSNTNLLDSEVLKKTNPSWIVRKPINNDFLLETIETILLDRNTAEV